MSTDYSVFELKTAFQQRGCPLCGYEQRLAEHYLRFFLWENVGDAGIRRQMLASLGYCPEHVQLLALTELRLFGGAAAVNIIYEHLARAAVQRLKTWDKPISFAQRLRRALARLMKGLGMPAPPQKLNFRTDGCRICQMKSTYGAYVLQTLFRELNRGNETIVNLYDQSDGLCLNHLQAGLECFAIDYPAASKRLAEDAIRRLEGQRQAMLEFIRKRDWNYRHEKLTPEEAQAWRQTLAFFSGYPPEAFTLSEGQKLAAPLHTSVEREDWSP